MPRKANTGPRSPVAPTGKEPTAAEELSCEDNFPVALNFPPFFPHLNQTNKQHTCNKFAGVASLYSGILF
jgi:hypothetical protein